MRWFYPLEALAVAMFAAIAPCAAARRLADRLVR
jgi:hypothetical protein